MYRYIRFLVVIVTGRLDARLSGMLTLKAAWRASEDPAWVYKSQDKVCGCYDPSMVVSNIALHFVSHFSNLNHYSGMFSAFCRVGCISIVLVLNCISMLYSTFQYTNKSTFIVHDRKRSISMLRLGCCTGILLYRLVTNIRLFGEKAIKSSLVFYSS